MLLRWFVVILQQAQPGDRNGKRKIDSISGNSAAETLTVEQ